MVFSCYLVGGNVLQEIQYVDISICINNVFVSLLYHVVIVDTWICTNTD